MALPTALSPLKQDLRRKGCQRYCNVIATLLQRDAKEGNKKENTYLSRSNHHGIPLAE